MNKLLLLIVVISLGCQSPQPPKADVVVSDFSIAKKKPLILKVGGPMSHRFIKNTTSRRVEVLYNSINHFVPKTDTVGLHFLSEFMEEPFIFPSDSGFFYANQLEVRQGELVHHPERIKGDSSQRTLLQSLWEEKTKDDLKSKTITFSTGKIKFIKGKVSCNDSDLTKVILNFPDGDVIIDQIINAAFFEYDIDKNGVSEQYIIGVRPCSRGQELAIIKVSDSNAGTHNIGFTKAG